MASVKRSRRSWADPENRVDAQVVQAIPVTKRGAALEIRVIRENRKLGILSVGQGGIVWQPARARKEVHLDWQQFARVMEEQETRCAIEAPPAF